ncbi:MAG: GNAT family N-acetyltransferase [Bacteroidia bacterium]
MTAFRSNVPDYFVPGEVMEFENFLDKISKQIIPLQTYYYVVGMDDRVIGCGGFGDKEDTGTITLAWGLIHHDFHKKGLGEKLLEYRIHQIRQIYPAIPVFLDTTQFTYTFFEKYRFSVVKITPDYYAGGMHRYDMVLKP